MPYSFAHQLNEFEQAARSAQLDEVKSIYALDANVAYNLNLRALAVLPPEEDSPVDPVTNQAFDNLLNASLLTAALNFAFHSFFLTAGVANVRHDTDDDLDALEDKLIDNPNADDLAAFYAALSSKVSNSGTSRRVQEYRDLYQNWSQANIKGKGQDLFCDHLFAQQAVAGACPTLIRRVSAAELAGFAGRGFPVSDDIFLANSPFTLNGDNNLSMLQQQGRLYLQDFSYLDDILGTDTGADSTEKRFVFAPFALYALDNNNDLLPIAIQMRQTDRLINSWDPIFVPHMYNAVTWTTYKFPILDGDFNSAPDYSWEIAKTAVSCAANIYHEFYEHLGLTHLMLEGVNISMHHHLGDQHPLFALLKPHFIGTLSINDFARETLINPGGLIDQYLSASLADFNGNAAKAISQADLLAKIPDRAFTANDVHDLPYYPYRDDALLLWQAVHQYASDFLSAFYSEADFAEDRNNGELSAFITDLTQTHIDSSGAEINGMNFGEVNSFAELVEFAAFVIYTASCQHAAVNYPQGDYFSHVALCPGAVSRPTPVPGEANKEAYIEFLPPEVQATAQMNLMMILSSFYFTQLGVFAASDFSDSRVDAAISNFQTNLAQIETGIDARNSQLPADKVYNYLRPSNIPQSTNI